MTLKKAIQQANFGGSLSKGLHETCKAVEAGKAKLVVLADNCDNKDIVALVKALSKEYQVPVLAIAEGQTLGEWLGFAKYDSEKVVRKTRKCSVAAIREFPDELSEDEVKFIMTSV